MKKKIKKSAAGGKKQEKKEMPKIDWLNKLLFKFWPKMGIRYFANKMGIDDSRAQQAHDLFSGAKRIDVFPSSSGYRGFILILDRKTSLYFYQDGDHFKYDGYEMGEYKKGDVTLFDTVKANKDHRY